MYVVLIIVRQTYRFFAVVLLSRYCCLLWLIIVVEHISVFLLLPFIVGAVNRGRL